jgi:hypothetical protein
LVIGEPGALYEKSVVGVDERHVAVMEAKCWAPRQREQGLHRLR